MAAMKSETKLNSEGKNLNEAAIFQNSYTYIILNIKNIKIFFERMTSYLHLSHNF
jgi:hypothetical protein